MLHGEQMIATTLLTLPIWISLILGGYLLLKMLYWSHTPTPTTVTETTLFQMIQISGLQLATLLYALIWAHILI